MSAQIDAAFNYNDLNSLEQLKKGARNDNPEAIRAVAQQFESMFLSLIMQSMRDATDVLSSDLEKSYQTEFYRDMHDQQMALSVSQNGGFGLADVLYEQLSAAQDKRPLGGGIKDLDESIRPILPAGAHRLRDLSAASNIEVAVDNAENNALRKQEIDAQLDRPSTQNQPSIQDQPTTPIQLSTQDQPSAGKETPVGVSSVVNPAAKKTVFNSPEDFIKSLLPIAEKSAKALGLEPEILVAQAALETGWGKYVIPRENGESSFNFFGIKADDRWEGDQAMTTTHEFIAGKKLTIKAPFRAYDSIEKSFEDYVSFLKSSNRYQQAVSQASNPEAFVSELQNAGYATDPNYAEKILRIASSDVFTRA